MSVIGKDINENYYKIYCKGSPEKIKKLCLIDTIPDNFDQILDYYAAKGYRLLAMASQFIEINDINKIELIQREKVENKMIFLGFLIVTNKLKPDTKSTIINLDKADLSMMMATGDNILTAISVSKECGIVKKDQEIYSLELEKNENGEEYFFWDVINEDKNGNKNNISENEIDNSNHIDDYNDLLEDKSLISIYPPKMVEDFVISESKDKDEKLEDQNDNISTIVSISTNNNSNASRSRRQSISINMDKENKIKFVDDFSPLKISKTNNYSIALTGDTFNKLSELNQLYLLLKQKSLLKAHQTFRLVLKNGNVFARMNPQHKALLVESLKNEGLNPLMCGDGSNDCLALRKANVGVSLSVEEASIAAHFTSLHPGINCLIHLLKEGKCSLAASIQVFKYVMLESTIQFISVTLIMIYHSYFSDFQFLFGDILISFPVVSFFLVTNPADELTYKYPLSGILELPVLISIFCQMFFVFFFQFGGNLLLKKLYKWETICGYIPDSYIPFECEENTIFFIISHFQFISCSLAFCTSKPFRQHIFKNWYQVIYYIVLIFFMSWITINCDDISRHIFMLYDFDKYYTRYESNSISPRMFKYILYSIVIINFNISFIFERVCVKFIEIFWYKNNIKKYKNEINLINEKKILNENESDEIELFKYHDVYYYDRRHGEREGLPKKKSNKKDRKNFIELEGANDNNDTSSK